MQRRFADPQNTTSGLRFIRLIWSASRWTMLTGRNSVLSGITSRGQNVHTALQTDVNSRSIVGRKPAEGAVLEEPRAREHDAPVRPW